MARRTYMGLNCSVARSLENIGDRWTFLIIKDAFFGIRRFGDFHESLGVARNILAARLSALVESGIMRRVQYQERPVRHEYRLTAKGRDLIPILLAMTAWGDKWGDEYDGDEDEPGTLIHSSCGSAMRPRTVCVACGEEVDAFNLTVDPIPEIVVRNMRRSQPV